MSFTCQPCSYTTTRQIDLTRHETTKKHLSKVEELAIESAKNLEKSSPGFKCGFCDTVYSTSSNRSKHMKKCPKNIISEVIKEK
ncbi:MAG: hypothetical protein Barrevirus9_23, partial [Barrevirus sp.]